MTETLPPPDPSRFPPLTATHLRMLPAGSRLARIYFTGGAHATSWAAFRRFGPTGSRFDHHLPPPSVRPDRGVLYAATAVPWLSTACAPVVAVVAEAFRDRGVIEVARDVPYLAVFDLARDVRLLDVSDGLWITKAGGNAAISSGPWARAQEWARAIWDTYPNVDGVVYASSNVPAARVVALWERAEDALPAAPLSNRPLADPDLALTMESCATQLGLPLLR